MRTIYGNHFQNRVAIFGGSGSRKGIRKLNYIIHIYIHIYIHTYIWTPIRGFLWLKTQNVM